MKKQKSLKHKRKKNYNTRLLSDKRKSKTMRLREKKKESAKWTLLIEASIYKTNTKKCGIFNI